MLTGYSNIISVTTDCFDPDASAFISAAGITDATQQNAINNLVVGLKAQSLWTKMKAVYPFVGGSATSHKFNLKDPRDLDAAFRLTFSGGWTHSANGALPNGTNAFADTYFNLSLNSTTSDISAGIYLRTNSITTGISIGAIDSGFVGLQITPKFTDNNTYYGANDFIVDGSGTYVTNTQRLFIVNREAANSKRLYRDGVVLNTATPTISSTPNFKVYLGARNNAGSTDFYDSRELAFSFLGNTLSTTDVANITNLINSFQVALSRNV